MREAQEDRARARCKQDTIEAPSSVHTHEHNVFPPIEKGLRTGSLRTVEIECNCLTLSRKLQIMELH